ncbi:enoyl-ACP reductase FabI [Roseateles koreensis]|uniref:Enoyl-[acyl-carrier-protein] reductase [NADH] n=1 Tax=Roseateles koreensis TaxID=2987526 RepID=A0ABT5KP16_9BURK|nr:enoyl-ACP reductase FabI [Roseateles koreensis]MDC8784195.1 enoyl-ACP reductase FabI [Roseateles koreensis]
MNTALTTSLDATSLPTSLQGKRGLILGLADAHSIALGCAQAAHSAGARLTLTCLNEKAQVAVAPLAASVGAQLMVCNVEAEGALESTVQQAATQMGGLDFVIHSIAWAPLAELHGRVVDTSAAGFQRAMEVSCHSFARLARCCEPLMTQGGSLITMSYLGSQQVVPNYGLMGPVKAALESLVRYLAMELGPRNIRVHAVSPGPIATRAASGLEDFEALMEDARARSPLGRLVTLAEIGALAAFLASPAAAGMTGQTLFVDAGHHAAH